MQAAMSRRFRLSSPPIRLTPGQPGWPAQLQDLGPRQPGLLRVAGQLPELAGAVAIVGTRYADTDALGLARDLGRELALAGHVVLSGGAAGIDAAAHCGALDAGGITIAVLATGLQNPYPARHAELFMQIAATGALVTENEDDAVVRRHSFLARNRLIAAMSDAVVVVQAPMRSGALSTAALAFKLERPVFAVPYAPWEVRGEGCIELLRRGANICTSTRDILSLPLRRGGMAAPGVPGIGDETPCQEPLDEDCRAVLGALRSRSRHPDELTVSLGLHILKIRQALTQLLLLGLVNEVGPDTYAKRSSSNQR